MNFVFNIVPLSVNQLWRFNSYTKKMYRTKIYTEWLTELQNQARAQMKGLEMITYNCICEVDFHISHDNDIDNMLKSLFDGMTSIVMEDDALIHQLIATKHEVKRGDEKIEVKLLEYK